MTGDRGAVLAVRNEAGNSDWPTRWIATDSEGHVAGSVNCRLSVLGDLSRAYPAGLADRELAVEAGTSAPALAQIVTVLFERYPRCRRIVFSAAVGDLDSIALAESAGFRFTVDVETPTRQLSLLVAEPEWVLVQPSALEDIPL
jgi:hypothetical protein